MSGSFARRGKVAALFQTCLGGIFLAVFVSLSFQLPTLVGSRGLLPVAASLESVRDPGLSEVWSFPTLFWLFRSDAAIPAFTWTAAALALLLAAGVAPRAATFGLWLLFLSCITAGRDFFQYQWDNLLLESSFLALFLPSTGGLRGLLRPGRLREPAPALVFLFRWLLFRLLFESAWAKVVAGEGSWWDLSAMTYYYETAPLPSWGGWLVQQAPLWFHQASVVFTFLVEGLLALLAFAPRRFRLALFAANSAFQASIFLTSNYGYFNPLSAALSLFLLEDRDLEIARSLAARALGALRGMAARLVARLRPRALRPGWLRGAPTAPGRGEGARASEPGSLAPAPEGRGGPPAQESWISLRRPGSASGASTPGSAGVTSGTPAGGARALRVAARIGWAALGAFIVGASLLEAAFYFVPRSWPAGIELLRALEPLRVYAPLRIVSVYHLFPGVLRERLVVEVNGSIDGVTWLPYRFRYTPGDPRVAPPTTWLHNPRFAFHYSFLPLSRRRDFVYFNALLQRLCCDPGAIASLVAQNPFPGGRPRALRFDIYRYRFGDLEHLRRTGEYWVRHFLGSHAQRVGCRCPEGRDSAPGGAGRPPGVP